MRSRPVVAAMASVLLFPLAAAAQPAKGAAGAPGESWELTVKMEMEGMPMAMPATTQRMCLAAQAGDEGFVPRSDNCRVTETRRSGNTQRFRMVCTGKDPMTGEGEITHAGSTYSGRMRLSGKVDGEPMNMTQTFSGRKLGPCTDTVQSQMARAQAEGAAAAAEACREATQGLIAELFRPGAACASQRDAFCGEVTKVATAARDPSGHVALTKRNRNPGPAFETCNQDFAAVTRAACARAGETRNYEFVAGGSCDDDVRRIGDTSCRGRSFTAIEASMRSVCVRYAAINRGQPAPTTTAAQPAAAPRDGVQQGLDAVRKLLPF
jgi:hypothetical protein